MYVKRRASPGDIGVNRKDTAGECRQHVTIYLGAKDRALLFGCFANGWPEVLQGSAEKRHGMKIKIGSWADYDFDKEDAKIAVPLILLLLGLAFTPRGKSGS